MALDDDVRPELSFGPLPKLRWTTFDRTRWETMRIRAGWPCWTCESSVSLGGTDDFGTHGKTAFRIPMTLRPDAKSELDVRREARRQRRERGAGVALTGSGMFLLVGTSAGVLPDGESIRLLSVRRRRGRCGKWPAAGQQVGFRLERERARPVAFSSGGSHLFFTGTQVS